MKRPTSEVIIGGGAFLILSIFTIIRIWIIDALNPSLGWGEDTRKSGGSPGMRRLKRTFNQITAKWFDVPQDVSLDLPRLMMIGDMQLCIENHDGVLHFSNERLDLAINKGRIEVHGRELVIRSILPEEVWIEGKISEIKYGLGPK